MSSPNDNNTPRFSIEPSMILQILVILGSIIAIWTNLNSEIQTNRSELDLVESRVQVLEKNYLKIEEDTEKNSERMNDKVDTILTAINQTNDKVNAMYVVLNDPRLVSSNRAPN